MSVKFHLNHHSGEASPGASLFELAEKVGVRVPNSCRAQGKCRECVIEVAQGADRLNPRTAAEAHLRGPFRLACQARIAAPEGLVIGHTMRRGTMRVEREACALPSQDGRPRAFDPAVTREGERVLLDGETLDERPGPLLGLAIDLGTTTVVVRLLDLETGLILADRSFENPQRFGGSEVMARIAYDENDHTHSLQRTLLGYLNHAIEELPADPESIYEVIIAGNSTMRDLFFRLSVRSIGQSPYQSVTEFELAAGKRTSTALAATARQLGLRAHPRARVVGLPIISGHVGADTAACMLAIDLAHEERLVALMDIGTNTELILGNRHRLLAASCPAGPAFEGGQIAHGMPGLPGAIEHVVLDDEGVASLRVIGDGEPEGICGSGLVDLLAELLRTGRMNGLGRFDEDETEDPFVLCRSSDGPITFGEADVNALAQAKGANVAGLQIIFQEYGAGGDELAAFYLAGGFGRHLNLEAARRIGLLPDLPPERIHQVGNATIEGACIALLSRSRRAELEGLLKTVTHCRLETHPGFFDFFVEGCQFIPFRPSGVATA